MQNVGSFRECILTLAQRGESLKKEIETHKNDLKEILKSAKEALRHSSLEARELEQKISKEHKEAKDEMGACVEKVQTLTQISHQNLQATQKLKERVEELHTHSLAALEECQKKQEELFTLERGYTHTLSEFKDTLEQFRGIDFTTLSKEVVLSHAKEGLEIALEGLLQKDSFKALEQRVLEKMQKALLHLGEFLECFRGLKVDAREFYSHIEKRFYEILKCVEIESCKLDLKARDLREYLLSFIKRQRELLGEQFREYREDLETSYKRALNLQMQTQKHIEALHGDFKFLQSKDLSFRMLQKRAILALSRAILTSVGIEVRMLRAKAFYADYVSFNTLVQTRKYKEATQEIFKNARLFYGATKRLSCHHLAQSQRYSRFMVESLQKSLFLSLRKGVL